MGSLAILGAGGHGRVVADSAEAAGWSPIRFFDDRTATSAGLPWPVAGGLADLLDMAAGTAFIVGIGDNSSRLAHHHSLVQAGLEPVSVVHPWAVVSSRAAIGRGAIIVGGAVVNIGCRLGEAVIVNTGSVIDHDCVLDDGVHVSPGAILAGGVCIGAESWIGAGAVVREGITIGSRCRIGAGAVVVKPVADGHTVVGNPACLLEK
jgi:sugar O-acyltransferase (sialic acid O-acetyltransferase NeuD family)